MKTALFDGAPAAVTAQSCWTAEPRAKPGSQSSAMLACSAVQTKGRPRLCMLLDVQSTRSVAADVVAVALLRHKAQLMESRLQWRTVHAPPTRTCSQGLRELQRCRSFPLPVASPTPYCWTMRRPCRAISCHSQPKLRAGLTAQQPGFTRLACARRCESKIRPAVLWPTTQDHHSRSHSH